MVALLCSYLPSNPYMPADNDLQQIGLRLKRDQLQRLDQYCDAKGLDRTSAIRMAINNLIDGSVSPPTVISGGAGVDQQARDALEALLRRVEDTEQELRVIRQQREAEQQAMQAAKDDFASKFAG